MGCVETSDKNNDEDKADAEKKERVAAEPAAAEAAAKKEKEAADAPKPSAEAAKADEAALEEECKAVFKRIDTDGDGAISEAELKVVFSDGAAPEMLRMFDTNKDGGIDEAEWVKGMVQLQGRLFHG